MRYVHITMAERRVIEVVVGQGGTASQAARRLGRAVSSVIREMERNRGAHGYQAEAAQSRAVRQLRAKGRPRRLADTRRREQVEAGIRQRWSPEQIVGAWPAPIPRVCVQTIYTYIHRDRPDLQEYMRQGRRWGRRSYRKPCKYQRIRSPRRLEERPSIVAQKGRVGDWESDTLRGADRKAGIATHVDRRSGYVVLAKVDDRKAQTYNQATAGAFRSAVVPVHTLTVDHGMEFACFSALEKQLEAFIYFADAHCAWQRGCNENLNGLLRQYFDKTRDFRTITHQELQAAAEALNARPRKRLGYRTPADVMQLAFAL